MQAPVIVSVDGVKHYSDLLDPRKQIGGWYFNADLKEALGDCPNNGMPISLQITNRRSERSGTAKVWTCGPRRVYGRCQPAASEDAWRVGDELAVARQGSSSSPLCEEPCVTKQPWRVQRVLPSSLGQHNAVLCVVVATGLLPVPEPLPTKFEGRHEYIFSFRTSDSVRSVHWHSLDPFEILAVKVTELHVPSALAICMPPTRRRSDAPQADEHGHGADGRESRHESLEILVLAATAGILVGEGAHTLVSQLPGRPSAHTLVGQWESLGALPAVLKTDWLPAVSAIQNNHGEQRHLSEAQQKAPATDYEPSPNCPLCALNDFQRQACLAFCHSTSHLALLQGPPGTGKSRTIAALVARLAEQKEGTELILVTAPTNQALPQLALVFHITQPQVRIGLMGDERKILGDGPEAHLLKPLVITGMGTRLRRFDHCLDVDDDHESGALQRQLKSLAKACHVLSAIEEDVGFVSSVGPVSSIATAAMFGPLFTEQEIVQRVQERACVSKGHAANAERHALERIDALFVTLDKAGQQRLRSEVHALRRVRWCVVDEAAQAIEAHTFPLLLWSPERVALVGDPQQLSATVMSRAGERLGYGRSLMERLRNLPHPDQPSMHMLKMQYRMHIAISCWPNVSFYHNQLLDADVVKQRDSLPGSYPHYIFVDVEGRDEEMATSFVNRREAEVAMDIAQALLQRGLSSSQCIQQLVHGLGKEVDTMNLAVRTVDSLQGSEADAVVLSCARTIHEGLLRDFRCINVAVTRAQRRLVVIGHRDALKRANSSPVSKLIADAERRGLLHPTIHACAAFKEGWHLGQRLGDGSRICIGASGQKEISDLQRRLVGHGGSSSADKRPRIGASGFASTESIGPSRDPQRRAREQSFARKRTRGSKRRSRSRTRKRRSRRSGRSFGRKPHKRSWSRQRRSGNH